MMDTFDSNQLSGGMEREDGRPRISKWLVLGGATGRLSIDIQILTLPAHSGQRMHPIRQGPCQFLKTQDLNKLLDVFRYQTDEDFISAFRVSLRHFMFFFFFFFF